MKRIIVIDDNQQCREELRVALKTNYDVLVFTSYSDAILRAESERPFAIMLDIHMPNIDGYEVLNLLRNHPSTSATPIICMSSNGSEETRMRANLHGASGFIQKPFNIFKLNADITALIQSLNKQIISNDSKRSFTITHNDSERTRLIHELLTREMASDETLVLITLSKGKDFFNGETPDFIHNEKVIFLEMNPQLIIKFPYLMELSSVTHDLMGLIPDQGKKYHLIFDEIRSLLNLNDAERTMAKTYLLNHSFRPIFEKISYFSTQPSNNMNTLFLQKIARILTEG